MRWKYQTFLLVSWEICNWAKKQQLEPYMEQLICSGLRNKYNKAIYCHLVYLTYTQSTSYISYDRLDELQAGIKISGRNINNLRYAHDNTLIAESEEELKSLLRVKEEGEKTGL